MVLVTVATGFLLGAAGRVAPARRCSLTLLGTGLVAGGAQRLEPVARAAPRRPDAADGEPAPAQRPALAGRGRGVRHGAGGRSAWRSWRLGANLAAAAVALATFVLYVFVYTPLKPLTTLNTAVGAVPGALPPVIGWAAATGRLGVEALGAVPDRLPLAVPALPGDRLDLPRRLRPRRATGCCPSSTRRARSPAGRPPATPWP